jgi:hypothetical protein
MMFTYNDATYNQGYALFDPDSLAGQSSISVLRVNELYSDEVVASTQGSDFIAYSILTSTQANQILCFQTSAPLSFSWFKQIDTGTVIN